MSLPVLLVSVTAAASAAVLMVGGTGTTVCGSPTGAPTGGAPASRRPGPRGRRRRLVLVAAAVVVAVAAGAGLEGHHLGLVVVLAVAAGGVLRGVERSRQERLAQQRRLRVVDYCEALVGELRAGQPVTRAVERSADVWPEAGTVVAAARLGASVPAALRRLGEMPGAVAGLRLAGAWEVSAATGAGLVLAVEQVLASARGEEATARLVRGELASARATARLVTTLPLVVLVAAQGIGARPWQFLLDTTAGVSCLGAGVALNLVGLRWIDRIGERSARAGG